MEAIFGIFVFLIGAVIWLIPLLVIITSNRTSGGEKAAWILAVIFVSWFAWVFYWLLAPLKGERTHY
ncbi:PLDc N-terminal domain-containing protein [Glaciecola sp. XM2]|jgi:hypothetical protein|uniref:PLDc N-terminal domain-containing protein n=1 Tax=Glaciecola sp. XM2 TaxID=1914931 RepID=UPI001BDEF08F|nr:PLDc N-terminal domain-containing protein [Glaciecola sp. XM2]MBT1451245.1 PLDc N-terminal domain-containing protein [Glaciecola sp. XM2]